MKSKNFNSFIVSGMIAMISAGLFAVNGSALADINTRQQPVMLRPVFPMQGGDSSGNFAALPRVQLPTRLHGAADSSSRPADQRLAMLRKKLADMQREMAAIQAQIDQLTGAGAQ